MLTESGKLNETATDPDSWGRLWEALRRDLLAAMRRESYTGQAVIEVQFNQGGPTLSRVAKLNFVGKR